MAFSSITITFPDVSSRINTGFQFSTQSPAGNITQTMFFYFGLRDNFGITGDDAVVSGLIYADSDMNDDLIADGTNAAELFIKYFDVYYNTRGLFIFSRNDNVVTVTYTIDDALFVNIDEGSIESIVINNIIQIENIFITDTTIAADVGNECSGYNLSITTNINFESYSINGSVTTITTNTFNQDLIRGVPYSIAFKNDTFVTKTRFPAEGYFQIDVLDPADFEIRELSTFSNNTIRVVDNNPGAASKEYSLDNTNWQSSPDFAGLSIQAYTLYIRDNYRGVQLGCTVQKAFTVTGVPTIEVEKDPIIEISKANAINFISREDVDNINTFKNVANSFSYERKFAYLYCDQILFNNTDSTKIQLKSSYDTVTATLRKSDLTETALTVNQLTDNINKFASMDAIMQAYNAEESILYFNSGYYYDEAGAQLDPYTLNGNLPEFAIIGTLIEVGGVQTEIIDVVYLDSIGKNALVIALQFTQNRPASVIIKAKYNLLDYNIFDFTINWPTHGNGIYDVVLTFTDATFTQKEYQSENIYIADNHEDTIAIEYFNTNNRDIFYKYDIRHFIRVPILAIEDFVVDTIEPNITDNTVGVVKSFLNEGQRFIFDGMSKPTFTRLAIALSCEYVLINGLGYAKYEPFEQESIEGTNLTRLTVSMLINGLNYNNIDEFIAGGSLEDVDFDIPTFDTTDLIVVRTPSTFLGGGRTR